MQTTLVVELLGYLLPSPLHSVLHSPSQAKAGCLGGVGDAAAEPPKTGLREVPGRAAAEAKAHGEGSGSHSGQ